MAEALDNLKNGKIIQLTNLASLDGIMVFVTNDRFRVFQINSNLGTNWASRAKVLRIYSFLLPIRFSVTNHQLAAFCILGLS